MASTRKYMRLGDSHNRNEVPSGCAYIWKLNLFWGGVYVVNWGVRIVGPIIYNTHTCTE